MPSKKGSIAYENRLARRRMDRRIKRLQRDIESGSLTREEQFRARGEIREIRKFRSETYFKTETGERRSPREAQEAAASYDLGMYVQPAQSLADRNTQAAYEIGSTYYVDKVTKQHIQNPASRYTEGEMRTFFRATQRAWENASPDRRIEAIMSAYQADDLAALIELILSKYSNDVKRWDELTKKAGKAKSGADVAGEDTPAEFASTDVDAQTRAEIARIAKEYAKKYGDEQTE